VLQIIVTWKFLHSLPYSAQHVVSEHFEADKNELDLLTIMY